MLFNILGTILLDTLGTIMLHILGTTFRAAGNPKEAEIAYRKAIELKPNYWDAICNLSGLLTHLNRIEEAIHVYLNAVKEGLSFSI